MNTRGIETMERKLLVLVVIISLANFERRNIPKEIQKKLANHFLNCSPQNFALLDQIFLTKQEKNGGTESTM